MARVKIVYEKTDASGIVRAAIDAEIARLEFGLNRTNKEIDAFERNMRFPQQIFYRSLLLKTYRVEMMIMSDGQGIESQRENS